MSDQDDMRKIAGEWMEARDIIAQALLDMGGVPGAVDHNAAAIIARLAHAGILLEKTEEEVQQIGVRNE